MIRRVFIILFFSFLLWSCGSGNTDNPPQEKKQGPGQYSPPPVRVEVSTVKEVPFEVKVSILGSTLPLEKTSVSSSIAGKIVKNNIVPGKKYNKGDVLVELDEYTWKASLRERKAECEKWKLEIQKLESGYLPEEIAEKQANLLEKQAQLQKLAVEKERIRGLVSQNNLSVSEWDNIRFAYEAMAAQVKKAEAELALLKRGWREEDIEIARANLKKAVALMEQTQDSLNRTIIYAPFSGVITNKFVAVGEWLAAGEKVAELVDLSQIKVELAISEKYISYVKSGMKAKVKIDALPGQVIEGTVIEIIPSAQGAVRNFPVRLLIPNKDNQIYEGMFCRVEGILRESSNILMVHRDAFIHRGTQIQLAKINSENKVEFITITIGERQGEWFEILSTDLPLAKDDKVVVTNNNQVYPQANVIIVNEKQL